MLWRGSRPGRSDRDDIVDIWAQVIGCCQRERSSYDLGRPAADGGRRNASTRFRSGILAVLASVAWIGSAAATQINQLTVMPLGDSITSGFPDSRYGGYRRLLGELLAEDGYSFKFVGSQKSGVGIAPELDNEGHNGWTILQLEHGLDNEGWLETYKPDLVLLHIGTNDLARAYSSAARADLSALIDDILRRLPSARLIVAQIIPYRSGLSPGQALYDAAIPPIVASKGSRASVVDMRAVLSEADYADEIHPNASGYDKLARAWEKAIRASVRP